MNNLHIGSKVFVVHNQEVKTGYLTKIKSPLIDIFSELNIPMYAIIVDLIQEAINISLNLIATLELKMNEFFSNFDKISMIIDPKALSLMLFKKIDFTPDDIKSYISAMCECAVKDASGATTLIDIPSHRVFLNRAAAEKYLNGIGIYCVICRKEFKSFKDIKGNNKLLCKDCWAKLENAYKQYTEFTPVDNISYTESVIEATRNVEISDYINNTASDTSKTKIINEFKDLEKEVNSGNMYRTILPNGDASYKKNYLLFNVLAYNSHDDKRGDLIRDILKSYLLYLDDKFDPKNIPVLNKDDTYTESTRLWMNTPFISKSKADVTESDINDCKLTIKLPYSSVKQIKYLVIELHHISYDCNKKTLKYYTNEEMRLLFTGYTDESTAIERFVDFKVFNKDLYLGDNIILAKIVYNNNYEEYSFENMVIYYEDNSLLKYNNTELKYKDNNIELINNKELYDATQLVITDELQFINNASDFGLTPNINYTVNYELVSNDQIIDLGNYTVGYPTMDEPDRDKLSVNIDLSSIVLTSEHYVLNTYITIIEDDSWIKKDELYKSYPFVFINKEFLTVEGNIGVHADLVQSKYFVENKPLKFTSIFSTNYAVQFKYMQCIIKKNIDGVYVKKDMQIVKLNSEIKSKFFFKNHTDFEIMLKQSLLNNSGEYLFEFYPIYKYDSEYESIPDINTIASEIEVMTKPFMVGVYSFDDSINYPIEMMDLELINTQYGDANTTVILSLNKENLFNKLYAYRIKLKKDYESMDDDKIYTDLKILFNSVISGIEKSIAEIKGFKFIETTENDSYYYINMSYLNQKNDNVTPQNPKQEIEFLDKIRDLSFQEELNDSFSYNSKLIITFDIDNNTFKNKSMVVLQTRLGVINTTEINYAIGDVVWFTIPLTLNNPVHLIFQGKITGIGFDTNDLVNYKYHEIEYVLLTQPTYVNLLSRIIPSVSSTLPPILPIELLIPNRTRLEHLYHTYEDAKKAVLWFICPLCLKIKKPQDDKKAKKMRDFVNQLTTDLKEKTDKKVMNLKAITDVKTKMETQYLDSDYHYEIYKDVDNREDEDVTNISVYEMNQQNIQNGSLDIYKKEDMEIYNKIEEIKKATNKNNSSSSSPEEDITAELRTDTKDWLKEKRMNKNASIDKKYNSVKNYIELSKNSITDAINNDVSGALSKLGLDIVDVKAFMGQLDLPGSVKICSECQRKLLSSLGELAKTFRDLFTLGIDDIKYKKISLIDVEFEKNKRKLSKLIFNKPQTTVERELIIKEIKISLGLQEPDKPKTNKTSGNNSLSTQFNPL